MHRLNGNNSNLDQKGQAVRLFRNHSIIFGPVTLKIGCLDATSFYYDFYNNRINNKLKKNLVRFAHNGPPARRAYAQEGIMEYWVFVSPHWKKLRSIKNIRGKIAKIDPRTLDPNTEVIRF
jgi:hypothetical protein